MLKAEGSRAATAQHIRSAPLPRRPEPILLRGIHEWQDLQTSRATLIREARLRVVRHEAREKRRPLRRALDKMQRPTGAGEPPAAFRTAEATAHRSPEAVRV
jgi:hypothetical protein